MTNLDDVGIEVSVVLGATTLSVRQVLTMGRGAMIPLDCSEEDAALLYVNDRPIAEGTIHLEGEHMFFDVEKVMDRETR